MPDSRSPLRVPGEIPTALRRVTYAQWIVRGALRPSRPSPSLGRRDNPTWFSGRSAARKGDRLPSPNRLGVAVNCHVVRRVLVVRPVRPARRTAQTTANRSISDGRSTPNVRPFLPRVWSDGPARRRRSTMWHARTAAYVTVQVKRIICCTSASNRKPHSSYMRVVCCVNTSASSRSDVRVPVANDKKRKCTCAGSWKSKKNELKNVKVDHHVVRYYAMENKRKYEKMNFWPRFVYPDFNETNCTQPIYKYLWTVFKSDTCIPQRMHVLRVVNVL